MLSEDSSSSDFVSVEIIDAGYYCAVILEPYPSATEAVDYFKVHVQPLLLKGLTALAKTKPAFETIGACVSSTLRSLPSRFADGKFYKTL